MIVLAYEQERVSGSLSGISAASIAVLLFMFDGISVLARKTLLEVGQYLSGKHIHFSIHI
jgi:hypothetical protein